MDFNNMLTLLENILKLRENDYIPEPAGFITVQGKFYEINISHTEYVRRFLEKNKELWSKIKDIFVSDYYSFYSAFTGEIRYIYESRGRDTLNLELVPPITEAQINAIRKNLKETGFELIFDIRDINSNDLIKGDSFKELISYLIKNNLIKSFNKEVREEEALKKLLDLAKPLEEREKYRNYIYFI